MAHDQDEPTSLYVIVGGDLLKIGIAKDCAVRLANLQLASPSKLTLAHERRFSTRTAARLAERSIHLRFADRRQWGEWFRMESPEAVAAVDEAADMERPVTIPTGPRWAGAPNIESLPPRKTAPIFRAERDGPSFEEMEAMPDDVWLDFMRPSAEVLDFTSPREVVAERVAAMDAELRVKYPQYYTAG